MWVTFPPRSVSSHAVMRSKSWASPWFTYPPSPAAIGSERRWPLVPWEGRLERLGDLEHLLLRPGLAHNLQSHRKTVHEAARHRERRKRQPVEEHDMAGISTSEAPVGEPFLILGPTGIPLVDRTSQKLSGRREQHVEVLPQAVELSDVPAPRLERL